jgi:uncharacterized cupredoxin-like copper-binding protein
MRFARVVASAVVLTALASCSMGAAAEKRRTVVMTIHHSRFSPSTLDVEVGTTVRFVVRNTDPIDHELIVGDQAVQDIHEKGSGHHHGAVPGEISVPAGKQRATTYTFKEPGTLLFGCHLPGHYAFGMRGVISVES